tara:strand:+ start:785 stop:1075 length:291 start_codon:yes stop_codon:yes gene_type:complete
MPRFHNFEGKLVQFTNAEEAAQEAKEKAWADGAAARAWEALRRERDNKIAKSDWRANSDVTMSDAWKTYRQALRDLPSTLNDTTVQETITWPEEPS